MNVNLTAQSANEATRKMLACEALFAQTHKASFHAVSRINASQIIDRPIERSSQDAGVKEAPIPFRTEGLHQFRRTLRQSGHHALSQSVTQAQRLRDAAQLRRSPKQVSAHGDSR
jgi:hypothetical protein